MKLQFSSPLDSIAIAVSNFSESKLSLKQLLGKTCAITVKRFINDQLVGLFFRSFNAHRCCLCGSQDKLTGEHKIKASALKQQFGKDNLVIFKGGDSIQHGTFAQSVKSKHLKFKASICEKCNTSRTQEADREFDYFRNLVESAWARKEDPLSVFESERYSKGSKAYLNLFRYFAKVLCCQMAASETPVPIPRRISRFAIGLSDSNYIFLRIKKDWLHKQVEALIGPGPGANHSGLAIYGDAQINALYRFHSAVSVGHIQYVFWMHIAPIENVELRYLHPRFYSWWKAKFETLGDGMSEEQKMRIGFEDFR